MSKLSTALITVCIASMALSACSQRVTTAAAAPPAPQMPADWKITTDFEAPSEPLKGMSKSLGADLTAVRNTIYDIGGKTVQVNTIVAADAANADKLMAKLKTIKSEQALLRKGLTVYEFVGQNDVMPLITEGRKHLESMQ